MSKNESVRKYAEFVGLSYDEAVEDIYGYFDNYMLIIDNFIKTTFNSKYKNIKLDIDDEGYFINNIEISDKLYEEADEYLRKLLDFTNSKDCVLIVDKNKFKE